MKTLTHRYVIFVWNKTNLFKKKAMHSMSRTFNYCLKHVFEWKQHLLFWTKILILKYDIFLRNKTDLFTHTHTQMIWLGFLELLVSPYACFLTKITNFYFRLKSWPISMTCSFKIRLTYLHTHTHTQNYALGI